MKLLPATGGLVLPMSPMREARAVTGLTKATEHYSLPSSWGKQQPCRSVPQGHRSRQKANFTFPRPKRELLPGPSRSRLCGATADPAGAATQQGGAGAALSQGHKRQGTTRARRQLHNPTL